MAEKKILGRKRHLLVDTLGFLLAVRVLRANLADRDGLPILLEPFRAQDFPRLQVIWADNGYTGRVGDWLKEHEGASARNHQGAQ